MPELTNFSAMNFANNFAATRTGPTPVLEEGVKAPVNSELNKIARDISGALQYSFAGLAANPDASVRSGSLEADIKAYIKQLPADKQATFSARAKPLVEAKDAVRVAAFGRAGARSIKEHVGVAGGFAKFDNGLAPLAINRNLLGVKTPEISINRDMLTNTADGLLIKRELLGGFDFEAAEDVDQAEDFEALQDEVMDRSRLEDIWGDFGVEAQEDDGLDFEGTTTDKLGLWISRIKCVDETNPEKILWVNVHDKISIGGQSIDENGDVKKINRSFVGGGFDDGDQKVYNPDWRFHWFNLREGSHWPKSYRVIMMLAEDDFGGFQKVLDKLYAHIRDKVKQAISQAVSGALAGYLGPVIARAIGEITAWIVDKLIGWLINLFGDDIFPAFVASVTTPSMGARWRYSNGTWGNPRSGLRTAHFYGHGGHYIVNYYWKFFA